jgi:osmoprotectant transport system substrate-binding protein
VDRRTVLALLIAAGFSVGCSRQRPVIVGSKNSTEQLLLGEIAAQQIENRLKIRVDRLLNLSGTLVAHEALSSGQIDLYPEYTGMALTAILRLPLEQDEDLVRERVRQEYERRYRLVWMPPLGFNNGFAMAVRGQEAREADLNTLDDAARYQPGWRLGVGYEFIERSDGYTALMRAYSLPLKPPPKTMESAALYRALQGKEVDMVAGRETDGSLAALDVRVLRDDRKAFPPCEAAYVVRQDALAEHPGLRQALEGLSGKFDAATMQRLNYEVDVKHHPFSEVARRFLANLTAAK